MNKLQDWVRLIIKAVSIGCAGAACAGAQSLAQHPEAPSTPSALYVIYDSSNSMWGELPDGTRKYEAARQVLTEFFSDDLEGREVAFRAYGHRRKDDCRDSELIAPFGTSQSVRALIGNGDTLRPTGMTPIEFSLRAALDDFQGRSGDIVLISDGIETCDADPCALARSWAESDVDVRIHVVGFGLESPARAAMKCIADAAGGLYRDARSAGELRSGLSEIGAVSPTALTAIRISGRFEDGTEAFVHAEGARVEPADGQAVARFASDGRARVAAGRYALRVGVETANGTLYRPVDVSVEVTEGAEARAEATVARPPRVKSAFSVNGGPHAGANVAAFRDGAEAFVLRPDEWRSIEEGTYTFRGAVGDQAVEAEQTFGPGEEKLLQFDVSPRVLLQLAAVANQTGEDVWSNFEVWNGDTLVAEGHGSNGARVPPGVYEVRLLDPLSPFVMTDVVVGDGGLRHRPVMPAGVVEVRYESADGAATDAGDSFFIARIDETGAARGRRVYQIGARQGFLPGRYRVESRRVTPARSQDIEVVDGERVEIVFRVE